jgi:hypothetical protein
VGEVLLGEPLPFECSAEAFAEVALILVVVVVPLPIKSTRSER